MEGGGDGARDEREGVGRLELAPMPWLLAPLMPGADAAAASCCSVNAVIWWLWMHV